MPVTKNPNDLYNISSNEEASVSGNLHHLVKDERFMHLLRSVSIHVVNKSMKRFVNHFVFSMNFRSN